MSSAGPYSEVEGSGANGPEGVENTQPLPTITHTPVRIGGSKGQGHEQGLEEDEEEDDDEDQFVDANFGTSPGGLGIGGIKVKDVKYQQQEDALPISQDEDQDHAHRPTEHDDEHIDPSASTPTDDPEELDTVQELAPSPIISPDKTGQRRSSITYVIGSPTSSTADSPSSGVRRGSAKPPSISYRRSPDPSSESTPAQSPDPSSSTDHPSVPLATTATFSDPLTTTAIFSDPLTTTIPSPLPTSSDTTTESVTERPRTPPPKPVRMDLHPVSPQTPKSVPAKLYGVVLVGFNHQLGPTVEYSYPPDLKDDEDVGRSLPFLALPDGAHLRDEDFTYFHLLLPSVSQSTVFGISCNRQISASELVHKGKDVTRSTVQKAVVVLANKPIFGPVRDKLGVITQALFAQKDFEGTSLDLLEDFYKSLEASLARDDLEAEDGHGALYMGEFLHLYPNLCGNLELIWRSAGTSLREFIHIFRFKVLMLVKLLMLQKKIMFYGHPVERLCTFQYSLVSLIPCLLQQLDDSASPLLHVRADRAKRPSSLRTSDRQSFLRFLGLPLDIFGKDSFFQPYLPLQQIDMLQTKAYLVGTTNSIFQSQRDCQIDVIVNVETAQLEFVDSRISSLVNLTAADRKWMDEIVSTVNESWNAADPSRPTGMNYVGSDDFLRAKFEEYITSALAAIKFSDFLAKGQQNNVLISGSDLDANFLANFNESWVSAFRQTDAFELWNRTTDSVIFDLVEPRHPCQGQVSTVEDVGIRLAHGLHDLRLDENLAPAREAIEKGIASGTESVWKVYSSVKSDLAKRQAEYKEKREKEQKERERLAKERGEDLVSPAPTSPIANTVIDGVGEAQKGAAALVGSLGAFISARRTDLFSGRPAGASSSSRPTSPAMGSESPSGEGATTSPPAPTPFSPTLSSFFGGGSSSSNRSSTVSTNQGSTSTPTSFFSRWTSSSTPEPSIKSPVSESQPFTLPSSLDTLLKDDKGLRATSRPVSMLSSRPVSGEMSDVKL